MTSRHLPTSLPILVVIIPVLLCFPSLSQKNEFYRVNTTIPSFQTLVEDFWPSVRYNQIRPKTPDTRVGSSFENGCEFGSWCMRENDPRYLKHPTPGSSFEHVCECGSWCMRREGDARYLKHPTPGSSFENVCECGSWCKCDLQHPTPGSSFESVCECGSWCMRREGDPRYLKHPTPGSSSFENVCECGSWCMRREGDPRCMIALHSLASTE